MRENSAKVSAASVRNIVAIAAVALCATAAWADYVWSGSDGAYWEDEWSSATAQNWQFNSTTDGHTVKFKTYFDLSSINHGIWVYGGTTIFQADTSEYGLHLNRFSGGGTPALTIAYGANDAVLAIKEGLFYLNGGLYLGGGNSGQTGTLSMEGGTLITIQDPIIANACSGVLTLSGDATFSCGDESTEEAKWFKMNGNSGAKTGTVNLESGGVLKVSHIEVASHDYNEINFNGGTLAAINSNTGHHYYLIGNEGNQSTYPACKVLEGGAVIDSGSLDRTITAVFEHGGTKAVDGGLVKRGAGTLTFTVRPTFTGALCVREGMVVCPGPVANLKGTKETKVSDTRYEYTPCKGVCGFAVFVR